MPPTMPRRISVLHLRSSSGSGGGPEKTIYQTGLLIDKERFEYRVIYLKKSRAEIHPAAKDGPFPYAELPGRLPVDPLQLFRLARLVRAWRIEILHTHEQKTDVYGRLLGLFFPRLVLVSTLHGWITRRWRSVFYYHASLRALRRFHAVIAVSSDILNMARSHGIARCVLIHNAIDTADWDRPTTADGSGRRDGRRTPFMVGFSGRFSLEKGPLEFLDVAEKLCAQSDAYAFAVAGQGPLAETMKQTVREKGLEGKVSFLGQLDTAGMMRFYQGLDVLLSPSRSEGLPNSLLEAMAMRVPVVATDVGGVRELINDETVGLLARRGDIDQLCRDIQTLEQDRGRGATIAARGRKRVEEHFSFGARVRKIEELYTRLISTAV